MSEDVVGTIVFNYHDKVSLNLCLKGVDWAFTCQDLDNWLRNQIKYNDPLSSETLIAYEAVRDKLREILNNRNLTLEMIE